jgi:hypothetical protein
MTDLAIIFKVSFFSFHAICWWSESFDSSNVGFD